MKYVLPKLVLNECDRGAVLHSTFARKLFLDSVVEVMSNPIISNPAIGRDPIGSGPPGQVNPPFRGCEPIEKCRKIPPSAKARKLFIME